MYYFYNKNTEIFKIDFQDPTFEGNLFLTYAKYNDYLKYHEKVFGVKSIHEMSIFDIDILDLKPMGNEVSTYAKLLGLDVSFEGYGYVKEFNIQKDTIIDKNIKLEVKLETKFNETKDEEKE